MVVSLMLLAYFAGYFHLRSNSYAFANRLHLGISYEQLERGEDPSQSPLRRRVLTVLGWLYLPCILVDERLDKTLIRIEFPGRPEKF